MRIPADSALFAGHFPGHPILPGIAHLAWVEAALAQTMGEPPAFSSISGVRWRRPAAPGKDLELHLSEPADGSSWRFTVWRGEDTFSQGTVQTAENAGKALDFSPEDGDTGSFPPPARLLPHAPPALLVDGILAATADSLEARMVIPIDHPLVREGGAPAFLCLEAGAQAAALLEALARSSGERRPRIGYLVGIRQARLTVRDLPPGLPLRVTARLSASAPPLSIYEVECTNAGTTLVSGVLSTFLAGEEAEA